MTLQAPYVPVDVSDLQMAFPADALERMPAWEAIPEEFKRYQGWQINLWEDRFYRGLDDIKLFPKEDVDPKAAWRHLNSVVGSFAPSHEHKMAALGFLTDQWFNGAEWTPRGDKPKKGGQTA